MSAWTFAYGQVATNVKVNYASVGSGAGIAQITAKTVDFGATDAPMTVLAIRRDQERYDSHNSRIGERCCSSI